MPRKHFAFRASATILLVVYLHSIILSGVSLGQSSDCDFDPNQPSLDNARKSFLALNYKCAEEELANFLELDDISIEDRANAHVLLAEVYYAKVRNDDEKRNMVMEQFVAAFQAYREWRGELNIKSPEFMAMMKQAQVMVDEEATTAKAEEEVPEVFETPAQPETGKKKGPWYTKWWAIGLGVGVVVGAVVLAGGGGDDGGSAGPLPGFPGTPDSEKK